MSCGVVTIGKPVTGKVFIGAPLCDGDVPVEDGFLGVVYGIVRNAGHTPLALGVLDDAPNAECYKPLVVDTPDGYFYFRSEDEEQGVHVAMVLASISADGAFSDVQYVDADDRDTAGSSPINVTAEQFLEIPETGNEEGFSELTAFGAPKTAIEQLSEMLEVEVTAIAAYQLDGTYYFAVTTGGEDKAIQCDGGTGVLCVSISANSVTGVYAQVPPLIMPLYRIYKQGLFADDFSFLIGESLEVKEF